VEGKIQLRVQWNTAILLAALLALPAAAQSKDSYTPSPLDSAFGPIDPSAPAIAPEQIIRQFAAHESEFQQALNRYSWRRDARVQTFDSDNNVDGEYNEVDLITFDSTGKRMEKVVYAPQSTLQRITISPSDMQEIQNRNPFVLTTGSIGQYSVKYAGKQKVDEIDCYVFDVGPRLAEKKHRYFEGRVWVDATGLQIVLTRGLMVSGATRKHDPELHPPLTTWRRQVGGGNWFPAFTKAEGTMRFPAGTGHLTQNIRIRYAIKYTGYKLSSQ